MLDIRFVCAVLALSAVPARAALNVDLNSPSTLQQFL